MPAPLARGLIITVSILVAAGLAAYESPEVREWLDRSRQKIATAFFGEDTSPQPRPRRSDSSMFEDHNEKAERRRAQAKADILERRRVIQEKRNRRHGRGRRSGSSNSSTFDDLVDEQGHLKPTNVGDKTAPQASASGLETGENQNSIRRRIEVTDENMQGSVDSSIPIRQHQRQSSADAFESQYEQEMRHAWNMPLPGRPDTIPSSHASESLIDLTPTSEEIPDPDISLPGTPYQRTIDRSDYFSPAASCVSASQPGRIDLLDNDPGHALSDIPNAARGATRDTDLPTSATISLAGSMSHISPREVYDSEDDVLSEFGDGIRTPASAWTEVGSTTSGDA